MLGCVTNWCLMCELEKHVMMLRESGGPLSPSRILSHMRSINCQIGDGSQEDAHEFLRSVKKFLFSFMKMPHFHLVFVIVKETFTYQTELALSIKEKK